MPSASASRAQDGCNVDPRARLYAPQRRSHAVGAGMLLSAGLLAWGWRSRHDYVLVADSGLGYALGIVGLAMMCLLLLYSVRKHARPLRNAGPLRIWFHTHMVLGLLGPTAILLHSNFELGSLNSSIALACMLVVSTSGIAGRFFYTKIHYELFGQRATLAQLRSDAALGREELGSTLSGTARLEEQLRSFERFALDSEPGLLSGFRRALRMGPRYRSLRRGLRRHLRRSPGGREIEPQLQAYLRAARRVGEFALYERAFSLWHALHLPLCVLLFVAAAVHVAAVHLY